MAQRQLELSWERFRKDLNDEDDRALRATSLDDVRATIAQTERELASRQGLRNFDRLSPYINAIERYGKVIEVFCNSDPLVPYIWAPLKFIILAVKEQTRALDQILGAYAQVGNALPRLSAIQESFKEDHDFQTLFAFLYDDITEFHRQVYRLIRRPAWPIFFFSGWGRFERHFGALITNITKISDLIDKQATTYHILEVKEWRQKSLEDSITLETRRTTEQLQAVLNWLGAEVQTQKDKLDWLNARSHEGTATWITRSPKFRSWLQRGRGSPILWIHGKPGSGKSVLVSQVISFLPADPKNKFRVLYFFCDYRTPAHQVTTQIFKTYLAQCISQDRDVVPFLYEEYLAKGLSPVAKVLKPALIAISRSADMVRLIVDGLDEIEATEHKPVLRELKRLTEICGETCKLLIASQDIPSIRSMLGRTPQIFLGDERQAIKKDMEVVVDARLTELDEGLNGALEGAQKEALRVSILNNAGGMFLWINLILTLLEESCSLCELESIITTLPKDLEQMYGKLLDRIRSRCDAPRLSRVSRIFEWLLFAKGEGYIQKHDVLLGSSIHEDCLVLDRKTMPFPTALDICKPLIEDGPGGTVAFIHSTLPQFLIKSQNGPLISPRDAHEHIAFACVSHLIQILQFVQPELPSEKKMECVGLGCLGLQRYASANWIYHILNYLTEVAHAELTSRVPLITQLLELADRHNFLLQMLRQPTDENDQVTVPTPALQKLSAFPGIRDLIGRVISFQDSFSARQIVEGPAVDSDTTLLSLADFNYQVVVKLLLRSTTCAGLTEAELIAFKAQFGGTAFLCPVKGCVLGFSSETELNDHKAQRHKHRLKCYQGKCIHNDVGFANASSLHQHVKQVHKKKTPRIPAALRRKKEIEYDGSPVPSGSYTTGRHPSAELPFPINRDLNNDTFVDNDITDADFNFLDEQPGSIGTRIPYYPSELNPELPTLSSADRFAIPTPQKPAELGSRKSSNLPSPYAFAEPRVKRSRSTIDEVHSRDNIEVILSEGVKRKLNSSALSLLQETTSNGLADLDAESLSPQYKKAGDDWSVIFNPAVPRRLDVDLIHTLAHESMVCSVRFSMDGRFVATGCNGYAQIYEVISGEKKYVLYHENHIYTENVGGDMDVRAVCFSPDGDYLATGSDDKWIRIWHIASRTVRTVLAGHKLGVYSLDFSRDGCKLASGAGDRTVRLWDVKNSSIISTIEVKDVVTGVAFSPDCQLVAAGSLDNSVSLWNMQGHPIGRLQDPGGHQDLIYSIAFSHDAKLLVSGSVDRTVKIWGIDSWRSSAQGIKEGLKTVRCLVTFEGHKDHVLSVAVTPDYWVLSGSKDCGVQFWNPDTRDSHFLLQGHKSSVDSISSSPTGKYFATASADKRARIWKYTELA